MAHDWHAPVADLLRVHDDFDLSTVDRAGTPGWKHGKKAAKKALAERGERLSELQERLFAEGRTGGTRSVLLVLQGLDTAGKGGIVRHVLGMVDPQGVDLASFGVPTAEEKKHHHLWRIRRALPQPGQIGVFDRSHYEQVLVVRVEGLEPAELHEKRYDELVRFDQKTAATDTTIIKVALMVSHEEQGERLAERLDRPDKHWKYNPSDLETRAKWDQYQAAYQQMLERTSIDEAPWYVVPADRKWYARLAVTQLLLDALESLELTWPEADYDVKKQQELLAATQRPTSKGTKAASIKGSGTTKSSAAKKNSSAKKADTNTKPSAPKKGKKAATKKNSPAKKPTKGKKG
ncbi:PPK2 family polyphosphate kinase [Ruania alba]|uniref:Polyphosphate:nucleotide phosphotransferase, PPK2 family n=1 Tax=Ruania alba TaxID=648782 RepID=A0A1H5N4P5_9MICO|nr:polyphosphate:nucleotide phosphotransferase, PPK2 family [Ruania alba]